MAEQYIVTGPLAIARTEEGGQVYVYQGRALPENVSAEEAQRLVETGMVEKASDVEARQAERVHDARKVSDAPAKPQTKRA